MLDPDALADVGAPWARLDALYLQNLILASAVLAVLALVIYALVKQYILLPRRRRREEHEARELLRMVEQQHYKNGKGHYQ